MGSGIWSKCLLADGETISRRDFGCSGIRTRTCRSVEPEHVVALVTLIYIIFSFALVHDMQKRVGLTPGAQYPQLKENSLDHIRDQSTI